MVDLKTRVHSEPKAKNSLNFKINITFRKSYNFLTKILLFL